MTALRRASRASPDLAPVLWTTGAVVALGVTAGYAVASGRAASLAGVLLLALGLAVGMHNWRWSMYGLIAYIPISGIIYVAMYPNTGPPALAKDLLFVLPAYVGFFVTHVLRHRPSWGSRTIPTLFGLLSLLVFLQALNPALPNALVGAIGAKVWLLYLPMYFLGYAFVQSRDDLRLLLRALSLSAILPAVVGITEAILIYTGNAQLVYDRYGAAADAVTQHFAAITYATGHAIYRVPSTFSYGAQYYGFMVCAAVTSWAWWRGFLRQTRRTHTGAALFFLIVIAGLLTGELGAFLFIPFLVGCMLLLTDRAEMLSPRYLVLGGAGAAAVSSVIGAAFGTDLIGEALKTGAWEFNVLFIQGIAKFFPATFLGLGAGSDTGASRYAFGNALIYGGQPEAWYAKALYELGVIGMLLIFILVFTILIRALRAHTVLRDLQLRPVSAALIAFVIWNLVYSVKASLIDLDPINVYFWLFAGVLVRVHSLGSTPPQLHVLDGE